MSKHDYINTDFKVNSTIKEKKKETIEVLITLGLISTKRVIEIKNINKYSLEELNVKARRRYSSIINQGGNVKIVGKDKYSTDNQ